MQTPSGLTNWGVVLIPYPLFLFVVFLASPSRGWENPVRQYRYLHPVVYQQTRMLHALPPGLKMAELLGSSCPDVPVDDELYFSGRVILPSQLVV